MNIAQSQANQLENRMIRFAADCINLSRALGISAENQIILNQLIRSATSVGANYAEANNAVSKQDFKNKLYISKKEASETRYWLRLLKTVDASGQNIDGLIDECTQLVLILQKSVSTLLNGRR